MSKSFKITYSALNADMSVIHKEFDEAYGRLKAELGYDVPSVINGRNVKSGKVNKKFNPANTSEHH